MRHLIKSLMTAFVVVSMVLCFAGISSAYTYDSEINPAEFTSWEKIGSMQTSPFGGIVMLKNPDPDAKIKEIALNVYNDCLISYWYTIDGKVYKYEFNSETENYDLVISKADPEAAPKK